MHYYLYSDGGARGNPGPAAAAFFLFQDEIYLASAGIYLGVTTNNVAEYRAVEAGLEAALVRLSPTGALTCKLDSQLVVQQLRGIYRVKQPHLLPLYHRVLALSAEIESRGVTPVQFVHIPRTENRQADGLVNQTLDGQ